MILVGFKNTTKTAYNITLLYCTAKSLAMYKLTLSVVQFIKWLN